MMGRIEKRVAAVCLVLLVLLGACAQHKAPPPPNLSIDEEFNREFQPKLSYVTNDRMPYTKKNKFSRLFMFGGQFFDLGTTTYALSTGDFKEVNPLGYWGVVVAKIITLGVTYYLVEIKCAGDPRQQEKRDKYYRLVGWFGVVPGLWNTYQLTR